MAGRYEEDEVVNSFSNNPKPEKVRIVRMLNEELSSMLQALRLENHEGNLRAFQTPEQSSSGTCVDAFRHRPLPWFINPLHCSQTPQPQQIDDYYPLLQQYSYNRDVFPFPSSANYLSRHPQFEFSYNGNVSNPRLRNSLPAARVQGGIFDTIASPEEFNQLINKVQHLIRSGSTRSKPEISRIIHELASDPALLCHSACTPNGSRALQQLIKTVKKSCCVLSNLTLALAIKFDTIAFNVSGRHVIRECFKELRPADNEHLSQQMQKYYYGLATDQQGCILLNECIPYMTNIHKTKILQLTVAHCESLALDCYGTYVVQEAISNAHPIFTPMIVEKLRGLIPALSCQKEGSHLVEKCLRCPSLKHIVMEELVTLSSARLCELACNEFGNFVVQKALSPTIGEESIEAWRLTQMLRRALQPILDDLHSHWVGHNVCKKYKETDAFKKNKETY